jgi:hypothetical protein
LINDPILQGKAEFSIVLFSSRKKGGFGLVKGTAAVPSENIRYG